MAYSSMDARSPAADSPVKGSPGRLQGNQSIDTLSSATPSKPATSLRYRHESTPHL